MDPRSDPRIKAFEHYLREAHLLWCKFETALDDVAQAEEAMRVISDPGKGDNVAEMKKLLRRLSDVGILRSRHVRAKLRLQLHTTKGRPIKQACLDAVRELLLDAVGGKKSLRTCPIGPLAQHYLNEIRAAQSWPSTDASPREINLHLSEVWKSVETAIGESDLIRSERKDPPPWLVDNFEEGL